MAKESGLGDRFYVGGVDLSGDTQTLREINGSVGVLDVTDITRLANERIHGERSGVMNFSSFFNPSLGRAHPTLSVLPTSDVVVTYGHGVILGNPAASLVAKQLNYDGNRGDDGSLIFTVDTQSTAGLSLMWGVQLTPGIKTDVAATNGTGVDLTTVSTAFGWTANLHVFSITGTSVTVTLQDSADNATFANLASGAFTAAAVAGGQHLDSPTPTSVVRRYVRAITTGTFSNAQFMVNFTRNDVAAVY
jgi:hypothetical protein